MAIDDFCHGLPGSPQRPCVPPSIASSPKQVRESQIRPARVGIESVRGYLADGIAGWVRSGETIRYIPQITVEDLHEWTTAGDGELQVVDVRNSSEWSQGGHRSSIATSMLRRAGFEEVANVAGGFEAWKAAKLPFAEGTVA